MRRACRWTLLPLLTGVVAATLPAGTARAQERAAATTNAAPEFAFVIDPAATAAGLAPLRAHALPPGAREIRVWTGFGLGIPHDLYRLHAARGAVQGTLVLWWRHESEWEPTDAPESMHAYVTRTFACGPIRWHDGVDACEPERIEPRPDWRALLAQLDSLGISTLETPPSNPNIATLDGHHVVVEIRDGATYRTASFEVGAPATPARAAAILELLYRVRTAARRDSTRTGQEDIEIVHLPRQGTWADRLGPAARRRMLDTLASRHRTWEERRPRGYVIRVLSIGDCVAVERRPRVGGELLRPRLIVRDTTVVRQELAPIPAAHEQRCTLGWRVDDLFADVARALADTTAYVAHVEYDAAYGFPRAYWLERGRSRGAQVIVESFAPTP